MNLLAIDTSTEACSVAVSVGSQVFARHVIAGREQTAVLLPLLTELLREAGIDFGALDGVACGVGPGSFAGVRIGVGFVKGLALARDVAIVPVVSLAALAQGAMRRTGQARVVSCIDARMGEVYVAIYERGADALPAPIEAPRVCRPDAVTVTGSAAWAASGTGWRTYETILRQRCETAPAAIEPDALPEARDALTLARPQFEQGKIIRAEALEPLYLRNDVALTLEQQATLRRAKATTREPS
jgi:tRNA threonylcarbamoyladenosine biosynthesis protein TsaB